MALRRPAQVFLPGEFIKDELAERGWGQVELADILGRPPQVVNEIIAGKRGVTPETARGLAAAFGTSAELWLNLEVAYRLWRTTVSDSGIARRANLYSIAPIRDMCRRNWIEPTDDIDLLEKRVLGFFGTKSLDEKPKFLAAARKSTTYREESPVQTAWLYRAKRLAKAVSAQPYSEAKLQKALEHVRDLLHSVEEIRHVPRIMADAGIRLLVVEPLPSSRIDGACFWLDPKSPVIALSLRFDRIDSFWHTLIHEIAHVRNKDGSILDIDIVGEHVQEFSDRPESELKADKFAVEYLVPQTALDSFIARHQPLYTSAKTQAFGKLHNVHPGVVLGQLQYKGEIPWSYNRDLLVRVRHIVTAAALTDGWGQTLPAAS